MAEIKTSKSSEVETARRGDFPCVRAQFKPGRSGNPGGITRNKGKTGRAWKRFEEIVERELKIEVPYLGTTQAKDVLLVRAIIDGAIRLNPACLKAILHVIGPKDLKVTNVDNRQINLADGLLSRLAKLESSQQSNAHISPDTDKSASVSGQEPVSCAETDGIAVQK